MCVIWKIIFYVWLSHHIYCAHLQTTVCERAFQMIIIPVSRLNLCREYVYFCIRVTVYTHGIYKHLILFFCNVKCLRICSLFLFFSFHILSQYVAENRLWVVCPFLFSSFHVLVSGIIIARKMLNSFLFGWFVICPYILLRGRWYHRHDRYAYVCFSVA